MYTIYQINEKGNWVTGAFTSNSKLQTPHQQEWELRDVYRTMSNSSAWYFVWKMARSWNTNQFLFKGSNK